jgi:hypothetical protein
VDNILHKEDYWLVYPQIDLLNKLTMEAATSHTAGIIDGSPELAVPALRKGKLRPHERYLVAKGLLVNTTHPKASSIWLDAPSGVPSSSHTMVYRPMGDAEILHLVQHNRLPETQPYQAIIEDAIGREYAEKYLNGKKRVDTNPTTVVEFMAPEVLIEELSKIQHKIEDGAMSIGLGNKAGGGVKRFNDNIASGAITWRIVKVKRAIPDR